MRSPLVRVLGTLFCLLTPSSGPAVAHAVLVEARPGDGEHLDRPPTELELRFSEPVAPIAARLLDAHGAEVPGVTVEPRGETLVVRLPVRLPEGTYLLSYRITSADSHPVGATLRFGIGVESIPEQGEAAGGRTTRWTGLLARWLVYVTALGAAGLALFVQVVRPPEPVRSRTHRLLGWMAAAGIAAVLLRLGVAGLELVGLVPGALITGTPWTAIAGTTLAWSTAVAVLGLVLLLLSGHRGSGWMRLSGAVIVAGSFALTGHAASAEPRWLAAAALGVHTLCGAFWLASLLPLLWCSHRLAPGEAHLVLRRFSAAATGLVAALVVAGFCLAWLQLGGKLEPLWDTAYGFRLTGKLALVAGLLALAAANRLLLTPRVGRDDPAARRHLGRTLAADVALGLGVLAVTASFPLDPPPRAIAMAERDTVAEGVTIVETARGGKAMLTLAPGRPGANRLEARVTDTSGAPVAAKEATVLLALPEAGIEPARFRATTARPGVYVAEGLAMPRAGRWRLRLDLLVDDFTKMIFEGEFIVGGEHDHGVGDHHRGHDAN